MKYFSGIKKIKYEGSKSTNPLAFKYYNADEVIMGKKMKDHLKFSIAYWHTMTNLGSDPFGENSMLRPWDNPNDLMLQAKNRVFAAFEFMEKLGIEYFCFHDSDIAPKGNSLEETNKHLDEIVNLVKSEMDRTNIKLLWGTSNTFSDKMFVNGASTSPNADVFAYTAAKIKKAIEITKFLNGAGYTFWGGREGYDTLLNTNMKLELDNFARMLQMAVNYAKEINFKGQFYIEPKPKEPTKHQYDFDASTVIGFLKNNHLDKYFKLNIETNHATLSSHTMQHELRVCIDQDMLGSIDANQGDLLLGWDTDQFPTNIYETTMIMYEVLKMGGLTSGGLNFDAKPRRSSFSLESMFTSHIAGMDAFAIGLKTANRLLNDKVLENKIDTRYASYNKGIGKLIIENKVGFNDLEKYILNSRDLAPNESGNQESLEAIINQYLIG